MLHNSFSDSVGLLSVSCCQTHPYFNSFHLSHTVCKTTSQPTQFTSQFAYIISIYSPAYFLIYSPADYVVLSPTLSS